MATVLVVAVTGGAGVTSASAVPTTELQSRFAVLRHAPATEVPDAARGFTAWVNRGANYKVDTSQTRRVAGVNGGWWDVTPGIDDGLCFYSESDHVGSCASTANALAGRLSVTLVQPGTLTERQRKDKEMSLPADTPRVQLGLVPDDVVATTATAQLGGDEISSKPNADGLYRLSAVGAINDVSMRRVTKAPVRELASSKWSVQLPRAKTAYCPCPYYDGVPPGHYWTNYTFWYATAVYGNWSTLGTIAILNPDVKDSQLCASTQNYDGSAGGPWFCVSGGGGPTNGGYQDYAPNYIRRGVGAAGTFVATGRVQQFYYSLY